MERFINWLLDLFAARFEKGNPNFDSDGNVQ
jgi:hypothetical protein